MRLSKTDAQAQELSEAAQQCKNQASFKEAYENLMKLLKENRISTSYRPNR